MAANYNRAHFFRVARDIGLVRHKLAAAWGCECERARPFDLVQHMHVFG